MNHEVLEVTLDDEGEAGLFGPVIYAYTRKQALADGQQVQAPEALAKEAGFNWPVFITCTVFAEAVEIPPGVQGQDLQGRLWDLLWMAALEARRPGPQTGPRCFTLLVRNDNRRPRPHSYYIEAGPADLDDPAPAITIMAQADL